MPEQPVAISDIADPSQVRAVLYASNRLVHAPMSAVVAASIHGAPTKTTPVDADEFGFWDSIGLRAVKTTWANIKATLVATANTWSAVQTFSAIPVLSGGGITFPATQVPSAGANTLDDYEEGTFTPVLAGSTVAGAGTYSVQTGFYTKIGNRVLFEVALTWSAHTGTGNMIITGLPFTAAVVASFSVYWETVTYTSTIEGVIGAAQITLRNNASNAGPTDLPMDTAGRFIISGQYRV